MTITFEYQDEVQSITGEPEVAMVRLADWLKVHPELAKLMKPVKAKLAPKPIPRIPMLPLSNYTIGPAGMEALRNQLNAPNPLQQYMEELRGRVNAV